VDLYLYAPYMPSGLAHGLHIFYLHLVYLVNGNTRGGSEDEIMMIRLTGIVKKLRVSLHLAANVFLSQAIHK
jgi:hypothetical protein